MDEYKVKGVVLTAGDYKEKDILITLFTVELGKIRAVLRGAKQTKAKLKFAGQPFCFADWILVKRGEYFYVTQVDLIDTFYDLTSDYDCYLTATALSEVVLEVLKPNMLNEQLFVKFLTAIKSLIYDKINYNLVLCKFLLDVLSLSGYELNFHNCGRCNMPIVGDIILSSITNDFSCVSCSNNYGLNVSKREFNSLKIIVNSTWDKLSTVKIADEIILCCINVLKYDLQNVFNHKFKTF